MNPLSKLIQILESLLYAEKTNPKSAHFIQDNRSPQETKILVHRYYPMLLVWANGKYGDKLSKERIKRVVQELMMLIDADQNFQLSNDPKQNLETLINKLKHLMQKYQQ